MYDILDLSTLDGSETIALEKLQYPRFNFYYTIWKLAYFNNIVNKLDDHGFQFPTGSVVHLLSHMDKSPRDEDLSVIPKDIFNIPPFINETFRKHIYHNTHLVEPDSPFFIKHMSIYRTAIFQKELIEFRKHRSVFTPISILKSGLAKPNVLNIINHCPLWQVKVMGSMSEYKRFDLIMRSILDFLYKYMTDDRYHFLYIPMSNRPYLKPKYMRALKEITKSTILYNDDFGYYFLIHLYGYLYKLGNVQSSSLFNQFAELDKKRLDNLHIMLVRGNQFVCYRLGTLKELLTDNPLVLRLVKQINLLRVSEESDFTDRLKIADDKTRVATQVSNDKATGVEHNPVEVISDDKVIDKYLVEKVEEFDKEDETPFNEDDSSSTVINPTNEEEESSIDYELEDIDLDIPKNLNDWVQKRDDKADAKVDNNEDLTTVQKERLKKLNRRYKDVTLNGVKLDKLLSKESDTSIDNATYDYLAGDDLPDTSMKHSAIMNFDNSYIEKQFDVHTAKVLTSFSTHGYHLTDIKTEDTINDIDKYRTYKVQFTGNNGKAKTSTFKMPIVEKDGTFTMGGVKMFMKKQIVALPIVKIGEYKVSLSSNYNKALVNRNGYATSDWIGAIQSLISRCKEITAISGVMVVPMGLSIDYTRLAKVYESIKFKDYELTFNYDNRLNIINNIHHTTIDKLEKELHAVFLGKKGIKTGLFIDRDNKILRINLISKEIEDSINIVDLLAMNSESTEKFLTKEYVEVKLLDKALPLIFVLGVHQGLTTTLNHLKVKYTLVKKGTKLDAKASDIIIRFKDCSLVMNRYPLRNSLIIAGLDFFDTSDYSIAEFDNEDVYYSLLTDKRMTINYIVGIRDFYDHFVDPLTESILIKMKEPTNVRDLFIRAADMITNEDHGEISAMANHRLRGYERFNAILYNEIARSIAAQNRSRTDEIKSLLNPEAVMMRIIQDPAAVATDSINPLEDIKNKTAITFGGIGGRTDTAFVAEDRRYPLDGVGILSGDVPDGPKVAMNAYLTLDPNIDDTTGVFKTNKDKQYNAANILSVTDALFAGNLNNDQLWVLYYSNVV